MINKNTMLKVWLRGMAITAVMLASVTSSQAWEWGTTQHVWNVGGGIASCPAIGSNGTIYVGSYGDNFYALNPDGTTQHIWSTGDRVFSSPAIGSDGTIYVGSDDGNLYAFNPDGTTQCVWTIGDWIQSSPAIGSDGTIYVGSLDGNLYAFNPDGTTQHLWSVAPVDWDFQSSPAIGSNGTIYVGSVDDSLYGLNPDGTTQHVWKTGSQIWGSPAIGSNGTIYIGSDDGNLYAFNPDGTTQCVWITGDYWFESSPAIGSDGTIYLGWCNHTNVYAFNPDGTTQHVWTTGGRVFSSPAIASDGTIYVGSCDSNLYAFNPDGTTQRVWHTGSKIFSSPTIGQDGTIYLGSSVGLYAFNGTGATLATNAPWPKFHHNLMNTGRNTGSQPPVLPSTPTNLAASDGTHTNKISVTWNSAAHAIGYELYRSTNSDFGAATFLAPIPSGTTYDDTTAYATTLYYYWVRATNTVGASYFSSSNSGWRTFSGPAGVSATDGTHTDKVQVRWTAVSNATGYTVWRHTNDNTESSFQIAEVSGEASTNYDDTTAVPGAMYYYWLKVTNSLDTSDFSSSDYGHRAVVGAPVSPTNVIASDRMYTDKVVVTWDAVTNATGYEVWRDTASDFAFAAKISGSDLTGTSYDDTTVTWEVLYYYWVKATNGLGTSGFSDPWDTGTASMTQYVWTTGGDIRSSPAIGSDGTIYVGSYDNKLYALNPDGTTQHVWTTGNDIWSSPAIGSDGTIYVGSKDEKLYAFNPNGTTQHVWATTLYMYSSPAIGADGTIYVGSLDNRLYAFNPDGTTQHVWTTGTDIYSSPAIGSDGTIYVGSYDNKLYAFNPDGTTLHVWTTGADIYSSPAIGSDGTIYVGSYDSKLYAFNPDGATQHVWTTADRIESSPVIGSDGTIYVGSYDNKLYAFNPDGTTQRVWNTGSSVCSSPAIGSDATIYVGSDDGMLYAFNPDGTTQRVWSTGSLIRSSPTIGADGTVYVGSYDDNLYAFNGTGEGLATNTPWPKFHRDIRNTGLDTSSPVPPQAPTNVAASDGTHTNKISVTWNSAAHAIGYELYRSTNSDFGTATFLTSISSGATYDDVSAIPGTLYYYWVKATNTVGASAFSASNSGWRALSAPTGVSASDGTYMDKVHVSWAESTGASGYEVWRNTNDNAESGLRIAEVSGATSTNYDDTTVTLEVLYYYWVKATNGLGPSAFSDPWDSGIASTTQHVWSVGSCIMSCPALGSNGTIYVGACDSNFYAFNPDGSTQHVWAVGDWVWSSPAIGSNGTIYVGSDDGNVYAFNPDGTTQHVWTTLSYVWSSPAIGANGTIYVGTYNEGCIYVLNPDGTTQDVWSTGGAIFSSPAIGSDGTVYVGADDSKLYAFNPDGTTQHVWTTGSYMWSSPAIGSNGTIYVGSDDDNLYAFNPDGTTQHVWKTADWIESSPAIGSDGTIYVGSYDNNLYAFNPDGSTQHVWATGDSIFSSPAIGSDGTIYVGSDDGNVYAFNPDGTTQRVWATGGSIWSSPTIGSDGTVYVGGNSDLMYAFNGTEGSLATNSPWPKFHCDLRNTGRMSWPGVSMSSTAPDSTKDSPIPVTVTFTENVTGFTNTDITAGNATVANFAMVSPSNYTFNLVPSGQGQITANIAAGICVDSSGNPNIAAVQFSRVYDTESPSVSISSTAPDPTRDSPIPITVIFTENVIEFTNTDITAGNGTVANFTTVSSSNYIFNLVPSGQGLVTADIAAGVCQDSAGNSNTVAAQFSRLYDSIAPSVSMSSTAPDPTKDSPIPVTVVFTENVSGFTNTDITAENGNVADFTTVSSSNYTFNLVPSSQGFVTADIAAGVCQDSACNSNTAAAQFSRLYDSIAPSVSMSSTAPDPTRDSPIPITVIFTENVIGFTNTDITACNGTVSNFTTVSASNYMFNLVPSGQGLVTADIAAGVCQDSAGNSNTAAAQFSRTYDSVQPSVSMSSTAPDTTKDSPIPVTIVFTENVSGFTNTDITAGNGTVANFATVSASNYTFNLIPSGQGLVTADIAAGVCQDSAANSSTAAAQFSRTYDSVQPGVSMNSTAPDPTRDSPIPITVIFTENVIGFTNTDITAENGNVADFTTVSSSNYTFNLVPSSQGFVTADIAAGVCQDSAGNSNTAAAQFTRVYDITPPIPDPLTWQTPPTALSPTSIWMSAVSAVDTSAPVAYLFTNITAGAVSGWQTGSAWTNGGLNVNARYGFRVKARDALANETAWSSTNTVYTHANVPLALAALPVGTDTMRLILNAELTGGVYNADGNPSDTEYAVGIVTNGGATNYVNFSGGLTNNAFWGVFTNWGGTNGVAITNLDNTVTYAFLVKARNQENVTTVFGPSTNMTFDPRVIFNTLAQTNDGSGLLYINVTVSNPRTNGCLLRMEYGYYGEGTGNATNTAWLATAVAAEYGTPWVTNPGLYQITDISTTNFTNTLTFAWDTQSASNSHSLAQVYTNVWVGFRLYDPVSDLMSSTERMNCWLDNDQPTCAIDRTDASPTNAGTVGFSIVFSELVTNFIMSDIDLLASGTSGEMTNFSGNGTSYTVEVINVTGDGSLGIQVNSNKCTDSFGNLNAGIVSSQYTIDQTAPIVTISDPSASITNSGPVTYTVTYSGADSVSLTTNDVSLSRTAPSTLLRTGTAEGIVTVSGTGTATRMVTISEITGDGTLGITLAGNTAQDIAGNLANGVTGSSFTVENTAPTVVMSSTAEDPTAVFPITVIVTFSENVTGFTIADIRAGNATAGNFLTLSASSYSFDLTPSGQGTFTADVDAGAARDAAGNGNSAAAQFSRDYEISIPSDVSASDGAYTDKVRVTWDSVEGATAYEVWRNISNNAEGGTRITEVDTTDYDDTTASAGQEYYYWVKAENAIATSAFSASDSGWRRSAASTDNADSDMDGDGLVDVTVYHEETGCWYTLLSASGTIASQKFGGPGYVPVPGDFDGDGKTDLAVYHENSGYWYVLPSSTCSLAYQKFGEPGYVPVLGDYDGDGKADLAVYHETSGYWFVLPSSTYLLAYQKLGETGYTPVSGDFDGDGMTDLAVYHEASGYWYILPSASYSLAYMKFGQTGYEPVSSDFDGDGKSDLAVYHEASGYWYVLSSASGALSCQKLGETGYEPVPADYDSDGKADLAVYHEASGYWYILLSESETISYMQFGGPGYVPVGAFR